MRVTLAGKPAAYLKSSGIAHATKRKLELGGTGKDGYFDRIKAWNAEAARTPATQTRRAPPAEMCIDRAFHG